MKPKENNIITELENKKSKLAAVITELHFIHQPDHEGNNGETDRKNYKEDTIQHLSYLVEAVKLNSTELFNHYLEWAWYMFEARNTPGQDLTSNIGHIQSVISEHIDGPGTDTVHNILENGVYHLKTLQPRTETHLLKSNPLYEEARKYLRLLLDAKRGQAAELIDEKIMAGGYPFSIIPDLQMKIGADATAVSAGQAVETANALVR